MRVTFIVEHSAIPPLTVDTTLKDLMWPNRFALDLTASEKEQLVHLLCQHTKLGPCTIETDDAVYEHCIIVGGGPNFEYTTKRERSR